MQSDTDSSDDEHQQHHEPLPILHTQTQVTTEVSRIFQQNIKEEKCHEPPVPHRVFPTAEFC